MNQTVVASKDSCRDYKVEVVATSNLATSGTIRGHTLHTDQPDFLGGDDSAPTPPETHAFVVGSCVVSVVKMMVMESELDVTNIRATVEGTIDVARVLGIGKRERAGFKGMTISVSFDSSMTEDEKQKFIAEAIDRCPVCDNTANVTPFQVNFI